MKDRLVGLLFRLVVGVGVVVEPPADFDSLRGEPLRRLRATPPLSGEARPKSRLRRLAVMVGDRSVSFL